MSDTPQEISVIIPVYNTGKYISRCLDSVLAQTFKDFEIICVNDGSIDDSAKILADYAQKDSRVKIIVQTNHGQSVARNNGLKAAKGRFIYFVDSDDYIHPQLLEIAHHFIKKYDADWATFKYCSAIHKASKRHSKFPHNPPLYKNIENIPFKITDNPLFLFKKNLTYKMTYYVWARLYRRDLLDGIEFLPNNCFEDDPFIIAICKRRPRTVLLNEPLYYYIDNSEGISNRTKKEILPKHIEDYHKGLIYIWEQCRHSRQEDIDFIANHVVAKKLRIQYNKIKKADKQKQPEIWKAFRKELTDLDKKDFIRFSLNPRKFFYWLKFKKLTRRYEK
jgi:glycosyltransferase involved in cell wall biosynthesis